MDKYELVFVGGLPAFVAKTYTEHHATFEGAQEEAHRLLHERQDLNWRAAHPAIIYGPDLPKDGFTIR